jgi:CubicO group peptidase (beta-lactamase class C family)
MRCMTTPWLPCLVFVLVLAACSGKTAAPPAAQSSAPQVGAATTTPEAGDFWPTQGWRVSTPQEQGMDAARLDDALQAAERKLNLHGLLVIRHGYIVQEKYFAGYTVGAVHDLFSCTKSFTSALMGIAIDKGYVAGISRPVLDFFPEHPFAASDPRKRTLTVQNLLTMSSGLGWVEADETYARMYALPDGDWIRFVLDLPMATQPGMRFSYSSGNSHILAAIIQRSSGKNLYDFARESLFGPLGMTDPLWEKDPKGLPIGGWGLRLSPRDMAKLGYLYLHNGLWDGKQVVPAAWVRESTLPQIRADGGWSYGYQWWVDPDVPFFAALGRYGQCIFVVPRFDLVVVFTAHIDSNDAERDLLKSSIIPACTVTVTPK